MKYNKNERLLANILTSFPMTKKNLKYIYQRLNFMVYKKNRQFFSKKELFEISSNNNDSSFFGYYDRSPMNKRGDKILFYSVPDETKKAPSKTKEIDVMVYNLKSLSSKKIGTTRAFNWQQGAKLQWLNETDIIYNDFDGKSKKYCSLIFNTETNNITKIKSPIYDVFENFGLSLSFDRLSNLRPDYGYFSKPQDSSPFDLSKEGVSYVDLVSNSIELIVSIEKIISIHYKKSMEGAEHFINHIMISPCGKKFMFLHRWLKGGVRFDSLMVANKNGENLRCIIDESMVSHCFWKSSYEIICYSKDAKLGNNYFIIDSHTLNKEKIDVLEKYGDGHPHIHGDIMITDTYPNKSRMKELLVYNFKTNQIEVIGEFFESFEYYGESRCDLHPRISSDGKYYFFDSVHSGKRHLYMMKSSL